MKTSDFFELHFDKFNLRVPKGYWYAGYDSWVYPEGKFAFVGITAFLQTKLGDVLFFTPLTAETLEQDDLLGTIESIKATVDITMPVSGRLVEYNLKLDQHSELLSQDPYGEGWIAKVELTDWDVDQTMLLTAEKYFSLMQEKVKNALIGLS